MASTKTQRLLGLLTANTLLLLAILVFASGFFPYKPILPGLATFPPTSFTTHTQPAPPFHRIIFMVVDALRSDFVYGHNASMPFTQSLIRRGHALPFTAHATPPTVTMPRVKALTTGSVPGFLDLILNFKEQDEGSSLAGMDTWLAQLRGRGGRGGAGAGAGDGNEGEEEPGGLVFYGDDTWLKLFPHAPSSSRAGDAAELEPFFKRSDGTSSFFVSDFTEVDTNVTRHLPRELSSPDWDGLLMHYLGLDHIGHKTGPQGPAMLPKQLEMDGVVERIYRSLETEAHQAETLLVLAGDHGMNAGGNHGGSGPGETEPALVFLSPKFGALGSGERMGYQCPTAAKEGTEFHYYRKVQQSDLVPSVAALMGFPVSQNSLGVVVHELLGFWGEREQVVLLEQNARQILRIVEAAFGREAWEHKVGGWKSQMLVEGWEWCRRPDTGDDIGNLAYAWAEAEIAVEMGDDRAKECLLTFLYAAQETMSSTASSYNIPRMLAGIGLTSLALLAGLAACPSLWPPTPPALFFTTAALLYGAMMFASSYVEEEQQFWYWLTPCWLLYLTLSKLRTTPASKLHSLLAGGTLLALHRLSIRWNQTGQKHAGDPDVVHVFFPAHHMLMWILVLAAYGYNSRNIASQSFSGIMPAGFAASMAAMLFVPAVVFKLNFTQADAPELVQELGRQMREWSSAFDLVTQARAVFVLLGMVAVVVVVLPRVVERLEVTSNGGGGVERRGTVTMAERLHPLLTLFLMTQTRAPNVPLFLAVEVMRQLLGYLLARDEDTKQESPGKAVSVATSVLLLSNVYYFCMGGSNSISSIDLSNAYNGVADYNIVAVGVLLFASNWAGPVYWCSAAVLLLSPDAKPADSMRRSAKEGRDWVNEERAKLREAAAPRKTVRFASEPDAAQDEIWRVYLACMTAFMAGSLFAVMAACTALRAHLFIWTVFSPKYLYAMAWAAAWHVLVNCGLGSLLQWSASVV